MRRLDSLLMALSISFLAGCASASASTRTNQAVFEGGAAGPSAAGEEGGASWGMQAGVSAGRTALIASWWDGFSEAADFGGIDFAIRSDSPKNRGLTKSHFYGEFAGEARVFQKHSKFSGDPPINAIGVARFTGGWTIRWMELRIGAWVGNVGDWQRPFGFGSFSWRVGTGKNYVRLALFDQPHCYISQCIVGIEGQWTFSRVGIRGGFSTGAGGDRGYLQVPISIGTGDFWIQPGLDIGLDGDRDLTAAFTFSFGRRRRLAYALDKPAAAR